MTADQAEAVSPDAITVILDRPAQPGNIGACARAMGNMGLSRLRLVRPRQFPHVEADNFAAGAGAVLAGAEVYHSLAEAVADRNLLVAATNRNRGQRHTVLTPRQLGERLPAELARPATRVGLLFGTERTGLDTADVERAHWICNIPTAGPLGSLNLAQAVLIVSYEIMLGRGAGRSMAFDPATQGPRASTPELERLFAHLEEALTAIDFIKANQNRHMMGSLRALFLRAAPDSREVAILRGMIHELLTARTRKSAP
ncbi:MAG: RNA methyltransferase [Magnetococcales bacterium]|nr:RNA methyltransferase [Magnetococcales bacterium]